MKDSAAELWGISFSKKISSPLRDCVVIGEMVKNVMLNLFQHLMESISYEALKRVQGDKK
jgi:hypothetical protein